jgi:hypothetical protein
MGGLGYNWFVFLIVAEVVPSGMEFQEKNGQNK